MFTSVVIDQVRQCGESVLFTDKEQALITSTDAIVFNMKVLISI